MQEWQIKRPGKRAAPVDGALVDDFGLTHGYWEAKDSDDDLAREVKTDNRRGITNDPNRLEDEQYIVRLIGQVITVSLETVEIVNALLSVGIPEL